MPQQSDYTPVANSQANDSRRQQQCVTGGSNTDMSPEASSLFEEEDSSDSIEELSLQDQMQQAYAACQTTCLPSPGKNLCRCPNMHRARVLYLKTQGIDVTSDDDPRIDQVRDEDFVFAPGGEFVLDEESLAMLDEERKRREQELEERKWRLRGRMREAREESIRACGISTQYCNEERSVSQRLEFCAKRCTIRSPKTGQDQQVRITHYKREK